ncbi:MAG TPA: DUF1275 family protein [Tepidisphaeraceae bacterium]|jgi:uncharacterized membrane protein YoaK (UPF0700 family)/anti-anti-sigma regulatory factor
MFVSQAHSFRQQARLAVTLAWIGGYTNIVTVLSCGTVTSHASGTTSTLAREVFTGAWGLAGFALFLLMTFFFGAAVSGFCTEMGRRRGWESIYVLPMMIEAALLAVFALRLEVHGQPLLHSQVNLWVMTGLASAAMGLQNATITRISSGTVRTTHVTGVLTDLGHESVQFLWWLWDRRRDVPPGSARALLYSVYTHPTARRLLLLASILGTFALGAGLGTVAFEKMPRFCMFPPVAFLGWIVYQDIIRPIAEIEPAKLVGGPGDLALPESVAVFHLRKDHDREGRVHRMPNLLAWSDRLPRAARVVILDLGEVTQLDANAALELTAVVNRFEVQGRQLIIAGVNREQFHQINASGANTLQIENVCADLELAVAKGINLVEQQANAA